jgi:aspartate-semialdehyde dehydrogenase
MYPMPLVVSGHEDVFVGRIRQDPSVEHGLNLWIVGDNIRNKASNAVRIGASLLEQKIG